tara:strand:- start:63 stop:479 length:417 start_codon:yes stop_codon:yes gene_type:complete
MNSLLLLIIGIPLIEIYLFIEIGSAIGAFNTIALILITAIVGVVYARHEGFNTLRSGFSQLVKNEVPIYEIVSGAAIAFAAFLLIIPGFATDFLGFLLIFPFSRKLIIARFTKKTEAYKKSKNNFIEGQYEDEDENLK